MPIFLNLVFELLCIVVACIYFRRIRHSVFKWVLPFLGFVFVCDLVSCCFLTRFNTTPLQYAISIVETMFYMHIFYQLSHQTILKRTIRVSGIFCVLLFSFGLIFSPFRVSFYVSCLAFNSLYLSIASLLYLCERFLKNDIHLNTRPGFWIALGVSVFFSGCSLTFLLHDLISREQLMLFNTLLYQLVPQVLSVFLYTCIAISVILHKKGTGNNRVYETVVRENDLSHAE